jgi:V/A-type H+-transporting ATPase subunit D
VLRKAYEARQKLNTLLATLYPEYSNAVAIHGLEALNEGAKTLSSAVEVIAGTRNVMGVSAPVLELSKAPESTLALPVEVCNIQARRRELIETLIAIAEYEKEMIRLGAEIARVKRVVTMLEKILIPRLINTIRYLMMKFDEMEREDKVRSMKIKAILLQRT